MQIWDYFLPAWNNIISSNTEAGTGVCYSGTTREVYPPNRVGAGLYYAPLHKHVRVCRTHAGVNGRAADRVDREAAHAASVKPTRNKKSGNLMDLCYSPSRNGPVPLLHAQL